MGRVVDLQSPLSEEDKEYLRTRGRGYLIPANERRFGEDGKRKPEAHEEAGAPSQSPFYDTQERDKAVYDVGGALLPGATLDYDTGRAFDRENGVLVEPNPAGHVPGATMPSAIGDFFNGRDEDDSDIDEDIANDVTSLKVPELRERLKSENVEFPSDAKKEELQDRLAIHLQDKRNGRK